MTRDIFITARLLIVIAMGAMIADAPGYSPYQEFLGPFQIAVGAFALAVHLNRMMRRK